MPATRPLLLVILALAYFLAGKLGLSFAQVNASASAFWPPTGIALAAFLLFGASVWPAILVGAFLVNMTTNGAILPSLGIALGNTAEGLLGAWLVNRFAHGTDCFERARDVFKFAGLALVATTVSATVGVITLGVAGLAPWREFGNLWLTWWLGDASGALVMTAPIVLWYRRPHVDMPTPQLIEAVAALTVVLAVAVVCFAVPVLSKYPLAFLCLPPLAWIAFRCSSREVATAIATLSVVAVFTTENGLGPFVMATRHESLLVLQAFMATIALTMLPIAALVGEIARAIGERERATLEERRARADAEAATRAKDEFLAMLSHELRNPLQAIGNSIYLLDRGHVNDEIGSRSVAVIRRQTENLTRMVNDLLDVARAVAGKIAIIRQSVNIDKALRQCIAVLADGGRLQRHKVEVTSEPLWVSADPTRVEQILMNLLVNALKFTPEGGHINVVVLRDGDNALVRVEDDGVGIPPELLPRVFDLFTQGKQKGVDRREGGLGIGLALVKELVRLHGGRIEAFSAGAGKGSRFVLTLPLGRVQGVVSPAAPSAAGEPLRILLIDREPAGAAALRDMLEIDGHAVYHAHDTRAGLQAALRERPHIALIDLSLAQAEGYEIVRALRSRGGEIGTSVRLVALCAPGAQAGSEAFDGAITKPVGAEAIHRLLADLSIARVEG